MNDRDAASTLDDDDADVLEQARYYLSQRSGPVCLTDYDDPYNVVSALASEVRSLRECLKAAEAKIAQIEKLVFRPWPYNDDIQIFMHRLRSVVEGAFCTFCGDDLDPCAWCGKGEPWA